MKNLLIPFLILFSSWSYGQEYIGQWTVDKIAASAISNMSEDEANQFLSLAISYEDVKATVGTDTCSEVSYQTEMFNERDLHSYHRVFFSDLGIENLESVENIEIFCGGKPWYVFGSFVIQAGTEIFVSYSGYIYELAKKNT
ncbi:hypothetical protein [Bermanella sp. R86510]|uniref:hypothetical protein n=1 Tax=unclassified Bermanella TaxID=2627862 RepID=UPI0037CAF2E4